jgi:hypothetical protein
MKIRLIDVESFVKRQLRKKLQRDLRSLRIIKELDLETCTYYHLRKFLQPDPAWNVLTRRFVPATGYYVDVVLFRREIPRLALELKWHKKRLSRKDRRSLNAGLKKLRVNKVYYLTTTKDSSQYEKMKKHEDEKYRFRELVVGWDLPPKQYQELGHRRRKYQKEMVTGRNKREYLD